MIKKTLSILLVLCLVATQFTACKKAFAAGPGSLPLVVSSVAGNFTISSFVSSSDAAATFSGYRFSFLENGTVTVTKDNNIKTGTWQFDDSNSTEIKLSFADTPLNELNRSWYVQELTGEHMLLTDDDNAAEEHGDDHSSYHSALEFKRE